MFYRMYLHSLCGRRDWGTPSYSTYPTRDGSWICEVIVNNRTYTTDVPYATADLAKESAATKAWMITRNFSSNDGYYPGQRPGQRSANGVAQGVPVPIGAGRRSNRGSASSYDSSSGSSVGTSSGGNSPKSVENFFEAEKARQQREPVSVMPQHGSKRQHRGDEYVCECKRGAVHLYGRCRYCLRENGWA